MEVNVTSSGAGGSLPFASLRLVGVGPLPRAPQALFEIGKHIQVRHRQHVRFVRLPLRLRLRVHVTEELVRWLGG